MYNSDLDVRIYTHKILFVSCTGAVRTLKGEGIAKCLAFSRMKRTCSISKVPSTQNDREHFNFNPTLAPQGHTVLVPTQAADEAYEEEAKQLADVDESEATFLDFEASCCRCCCYFLLISGVLE